MKHVLLSGLLAFALVLSACERQSSVNSPVAPDNGASLMKLADQLDLSLEQLGQLDEMYYLGEDLSILLTPQQLSILNTMSVRSGDVSVLADPGDRIPRGAFDMEALRIYRLILQANPDMPDDQKAALKAAIDESIKRRAAILLDPSLDKEGKKLKLEEEHKNLMIQIFGENGNGGPGTLLDIQHVENYKKLVAELEKKREEERQKWIEARIDRQIAVWTKILTLTEDQQAAIKIILLAQQKTIEQLRQDLKGQPEALRQALKDLQEKTYLDIRNNTGLTPEQQLLWDRMHGRGGKGGGGSTGGIDREVEYWTKVLKLDTEAAAELKAALVTKQTATQEAMKLYRTDPAKLKAALQAINDAFDKDLKENILTTEQYELWLKMHRPGVGGRG